MTWLPGLSPGDTEAEHDGKGDSWATPKPVAEAVEQALGGIVVDPCAHPLSPVWAMAKQRIYLGNGGNGLVDKWMPGPAYANVPYSDAPPWLARCSHEAKRGRPVVVLTRTSPSTNYWHDFVWSKGGCVLQPRGRIAFVGTDGKTHKGGQVVTSFVTWDLAIAVRLRAALLEHARLETVLLRPLLWCEEAQATDDLPWTTAP